jgi:arylsulfatase A-like enzyme
MKRTLFEGGVRGVGLVSGAGLTKKGRGVVLDGFFHAADWMPTILAAATASLPSTTWRDVATAASREPPFLPGDGMNLWPYLSGAQVRKLAKLAKLAQKLGQLQPFMAVLLLECPGQLASFGPA